jgi:prevent-host-death family protein
MFKVQRLRISSLRPGRPRDFVLPTLYQHVLLLDLSICNNYIVVNMTEKISTLEVRQRLGDILNRVALRNDQFIIEHKGKPLAAVVSVERLEQMRRAARMHLLRVLER